MMDKICDCEMCRAAVAHEQWREWARLWQFLRLKPLADYCWRKAGEHV